MWNQGVESLTSNDSVLNAVKTLGSVIETSEANLGKVGSNIKFKLATYLNVDKLP